VEIPPGIVAVTTWGSVRAEMAQCLMEARSLSENRGMTNATWTFIHGSLVDKARNDAARELLASGGEWLLFVDGDMTFSPDAILNLVHAAYHVNPAADCLGGFCPLRGDMSIPTIDTGTGTWESHFPGGGIIEVMRTGGAFLLVKRHVFERLPQPWFAVRTSTRPLDALAEIDNLCHIIYDGRNPFRGQENGAWERLEQYVTQHDSTTAATWTPNEVGEDSAFCDAVRLHGMRIFVHTDISLGHVLTKVNTWQDHKKAVEDMEANHMEMVGVGSFSV